MERALSAESMVQSAKSMAQSARMVKFRFQDLEIWQLAIEIGDEL